MATERSSGGDPARTLALLWRDPNGMPRRGPRRTLDVDSVVRAAVSLADQRGIAAVTMRLVADRLGVAPMSIYTYVAGRAELLDLMIDAVYAEMPRTDTSGQPWRARLAAVAEDTWRLYTVHPWAAEISTLRPPLGPGQMAKYEHELAAFDDSGMDDVTIDDCLTSILVFVRACARDRNVAQLARRDSGMDDAQWWASAEPTLSRVLDVEAFPRAVRIGGAAGEAHHSAHDPEHVFRFGLDRLLEGLAELPLERSRPRRRDARLDP